MMDQRSIDAMTRAARAWLAVYDRNADGERGMAEPMPGMCGNCERIFTRDTLLENGGRGYLCPTCADSELARLRREIRKLRSELNKQGGQQAGE